MLVADQCLICTPSLEQKYLPDALDVVCWSPHPVQSSLASLSGLSRVSLATNFNPGVLQNKTYLFLCVTTSPFSAQEEEEVVRRSVQKKSTFLIVGVAFAQKNREKPPIKRCHQESKVVGAYVSLCNFQSRYFLIILMFTVPPIHEASAGFDNSSSKILLTESMSTMLVELASLLLSKPHN